ncbi:hypothetical protein NITLEN_70015 [Nitrospira lenta]|uniref:Uncharacterized protein n=1 Tax=Nitrospira lenta TaxID=1436998 RepID=A0A330L8W5_9BACT|nr:hypothetical protein NITLEN_70015 [Nitrospira lenta]
MFLMRSRIGEESDGPTSRPLSEIPEYATVRNTEKSVTGSELVATVSPDDAQPPAPKSPIVIAMSRYLTIMSLCSLLP